jgi:uncharacterized protein (TIGR02300 family)
VAKPEWGSKRTCQSCGANFYDLQRKPIVCPKCAAEFTVQSFSRPQRSRAAAAAQPVAVAASAPEPAAQPKAAAEAKAAPDEVDADSIGDADSVATDADKDDDDEEDESLIEDASELGEDEDDMLEVIDSVAKKEEPQA